MVKIKLPEQTDVEFSTRILPDDTDPRGNIMASGDDAADREAEDDVIRQLNDGNVAAWCGIVVHAEWRGFQAVASIWGCSYASEEDALAEAEAFALREEAFDSLCRKISESIAKLADRLTLEEG
jgi:hypothetical protein